MKLGGLNEMNIKNHNFIIHLYILFLSFFISTLFINEREKTTTSKQLVYNFIKSPNLQWHFVPPMVCSAGFQWHDAHSLLRIHSFFFLFLLIFFLFHCISTSQLSAVVIPCGSSACSVYISEPMGHWVLFSYGHFNGRTFVIVHYFRMNFNQE